MDRQDQFKSIAPMYLDKSKVILNVTNNTRCGANEAVNALLEISCTHHQIFWSIRYLPALSSEFKEATAADMLDTFHDGMEKAVVACT